MKEIIKELEDKETGYFQKIVAGSVHRNAAFEQLGDFLGMFRGTYRLGCVALAESLMKRMEKDAMAGLGVDQTFRNLCMDLRTVIQETKEPS